MNDVREWLDTFQGGIAVKKDSSINGESGKRLGAIASFVCDHMLGLEFRVAQQHDLGGPGQRGKNGIQPLSRRVGVRRLEKPLPRKYAVRWESKRHERWALDQNP